MRRAGLSVFAEFLVLVPRLTEYSLNYRTCRMLTKSSGIIAETDASFVSHIGSLVRVSYDAQKLWRSHNRSALPQKLIFLSFHKTRDLVTLFYTFIIIS